MDASSPSSSESCNDNSGSADVQVELEQTTVLLEKSQQVPNDQLSAQPSCSSSHVSHILQPSEQEFIMDWSESEEEERQKLIKKIKVLLNSFRENSHKLSNERKRYIVRRVMAFQADILNTGKPAPKRISQTVPEIKSEAVPVAEDLTVNETPEQFTNSLPCIKEIPSVQLGFEAGPTPSCSTELPYSEVKKTAKKQNKKSQCEESQCEESECEESEFEESECEESEFEESECEESVNTRKPARRRRLPDELKLILTYPFDCVLSNLRDYLLKEEEEKRKKNVKKN